MGGYVTNSFVCEKCGAAFQVRARFAKYCPECKRRVHNSRNCEAFKGAKKVKVEPHSMAWIRAHRVKVEGGWRGRPCGSGAPSYGLFR